MTKLFFLLGAKDPEMDMMEKLLEHADMPFARSRSERFAYATIGGIRVHAGNAYKVDPIAVPEGHQLVLIECEPTNIADFPDFIRIDHHRPGDPGYGLGPAAFLKASSIGQLHELLHLEPEWKAVVMAAYDHCFPAAARGECGDVTANEVLSLKVSEIAKSAGVTEDEVRDCIDAFASELDYSPEVQVGDQNVRDLRHLDMGIGYSLDLLTVQVAAAMNGHCALLRHRDKAGGPEKWTLTGNVTPATVVTFKEVWAPAQGLANVYGVPDRGYAGGYVVSK